MCKESVPLATFLAHTEPGDQDWSWRSQFAWLVQHHYKKLCDLKHDMWLDGQKKPVYVGKDGRLWDGHHRVWCAVELGWPDIEVNTPCENCMTDEEMMKS